MVKNNAIKNEEISSAKTRDNQNLSKEIEMENEQSYNFRNRDDTMIAYHGELQRRKHSNSRADTAESMDRKQSKKIMQVRNHRNFLLRQSQWVGIICPPPPPP